MVKRRVPPGQFSLNLSGSPASPEAPPQPPVATPPTLPANPAPPVPQAIPPSRPDGPESPAVRQRVADAFAHLAGSTGIASEDDLVRWLTVEHAVQVGPERLRAMLGGHDHLVVLPTRLIASTADRRKSPLTRYLRRLIAVCPGGLAIDVATIQLRRAQPGYAVLTMEHVRAFAAAHPDLDVALDRLLPRTGLLLRPEEELGEIERRVHEAIRDAGRPLSSEGILRHTRHRAKLPPTALKSCLRESCVLVTTGDGRYEALQPSSRLRAMVLAQASGRGER